MGTLQRRRRRRRKINKSNVYTVTRECTNLTIIYIFFTTTNKHQYICFKIVLCDFFTVYFIKLSK